jgi:DNA-binding transcriptional regulator GbsR (MarR family)
VGPTVAQIYALLFLSPRPLTAEEISDILFVARSNVSTSLRELAGWRLVRTTRVLGDRRDHYEVGKDVWETFRTVIEERRRREIDPTLAVLRECLAEPSGGRADAYAQKRLEDLRDFFEAVTSWHEEVRAVPVGTLRRLMRLGARVQNLLALGKGR